MRIWREKLYDENEKVYFQIYLQENSREKDKEIDSKKKYPVMIVCPGGGYISTSDREAEPVALGYVAKGYHVIILRYTTKDRGNPQYPQPLLDLAKIMKIVHNRAVEWNVQEENIFLTGFSAGGHLSLNMAVHWNKEWLAEKSGIENKYLRPTAVVLGYPLTDIPFIQKRAKKVPALHEVVPDIGISRFQFLNYTYKLMLGENYTEDQLRELSPVYCISEDTCPVFVWTTAQDELVFVGNTLKLGLALEEKNIPFEMHIFQNGPHGMSMATESSAKKGSAYNDEEVAQWFGLACNFLNRNMV